MRHLLIALGLLAIVPSPARADSAKMARLKELNTMLGEAMAATPEHLEDEAAVHQAIELQARTFATVSGELSTNKLRVPGSAFGTVQDNLRRLESRLKTLRLVEKADAALSKLEPVANAHGELDAKNFGEVTRLLAAIDGRGDLSRAGTAMHAWQNRLLTKLAEVPWPRDLQPIEVSKKSLTQAFVSIDAKIAGHRPRPIALLKVTSPIRSLEHFGAELSGASITLRGPVAEADGLIKGPADAREWSELEQGTYVIEAVARTPVAFSIVLGTPETPHDRFFKIGSVAAGEPLEQHQVAAIYPFVGEVHAPLVRQQMFMTAPRELFVYAREDIQPNDISTSATPDVLPRAGEPLLVLGKGEYGEGIEVISAEGFSWELRDWKRLATSPSGSPTLPAAIHPLDLSFQLDELKAAPDGFTADELKAQAPVRKKYIAMVERWNACAQKVFDKYGGSLANGLGVVTYRGGNVVKVEGLKDKAEAEANRTCKRKQVDAQAQTFDKQLSAMYGDARAHRLDEIRRAWAK